MRFRIRQDRVCAVLCTPSDKRLSAYLADRGHPNESDVCDQFLPYFGGTTRRVVPKFGTGRRPSLQTSDFVIYLSHVLDNIVTKRAALDLRRAFH